MANPVFVKTTDVYIAALMKVALNAATGSTYLKQFQAYVSENGGGTTGLQKLGSALANYASTDNAAYAKTIVANLGITGDSADTAATNVTALLNSYGANRGGALMQLIDVMVNLQTDATWGTAANAFVNAVNTGHIYSANVANTSTDMTVLQAVMGVTNGAVTGQNFTLTTGQDVFTGNAGADILRGVAGATVGTQDQTTLNSSDILDGGNGEDQLVVNMTGGGAYQGGATIKNIETLQIGSNLAASQFDYNVNAGVYEVTGVNTVIYDQINAGEVLNVLNVTPTATGSVIPTLMWNNEANSNAGVVGVTFREASITGSKTELNVVLDDVNAGAFNIANGVERLMITSQGSTANVLVNSTLYDDNGAGAGLNQNVDLLSGVGTGANDDNTLNYVKIKGAQNFGKAAAVVADATNANYGLTDRSAAGSDLGLTLATTASDLVSVAATVTEVDASEATGNISLRFTQKVSNADTNVTYTGGKGADYVEFERGAVKATGGEGADTFAFITQLAGVTNSGFGSTDSIDGGAGTDTIQVGLNGVGTYTLNTTEFSNKTGIDELDLRGANNDVTVSSQFVAAADTGVKMTIRTDKIVQTSSSSTANPTGANVAENNSTSIINLTDLAINQGVKVVGGSGSERVVVDNAAMNANVEIDGGTNGGVAGRYDTITVLDSAVLDTGDLANVKGIEALVLAETVNGNSTFRVDLTEAFLLNNTAATNATTTTIDDTTFRIGSANSVSGTALNAGDTVTIDISDLLNATRTALKTTLAGRGVDVALGAATVNYVVDGAAATAAQIAMVAKADAARADAGVSSAAGAVLTATANVAVVAGGTVTSTAGTNDTFTATIAQLGTAATTVTGTVADTETLSVTDAGAVVIPAGVTAMDIITLANGTNTLTGAVATGATTINGGTGVDTLVLANNDNISGITLNGIESIQLGGNATMTLAQHAAAILQAPGVADVVIVSGVGGSFTGTTGVEGYNAGAATSAVNVTLTASQTGTVTGSAFADTFNTTVANLNLMTGGIAGGTSVAGTADVLSITGGLTGALSLAALTAGGAVTQVETLNLSGASTGNTLTVANASGLTTINASGVTGGGVSLDMSGLTTANGATSVTLTAGNDTLATSITGAGNNALTINFGTGNATIADVAAGGTGALTLQAAATAGSTTTLTFTATTANLEAFGPVTIDFDGAITALHTAAGANVAGQLIFYSDAAMTTQITAGVATAVKAIAWDANGDGVFGAGDIALVGAADIASASQAYSIVNGNLVIA